MDEHVCSLECQRHARILLADLKPNQLARMYVATGVTEGASRSLGLSGCIRASRRAGALHATEFDSGGLVRRSEVDKHGMCFSTSLLDYDDFGGDLALTRVVKPEVHAEGQKTS